MCIRDSGTRNSIGLSTSIKGGYRLIVDLGMNKNYVKFPDAEVNADVYTLKIKYNHSINLLNSLYLQYNEAERKLITNVRINIIHAPLSDLFLVYSEMRDVDNTNSKSGYIALKLTKLFGI